MKRKKKNGKKRKSSKHKPKKKKTSASKPKQSFRQKIESAQRKRHDKLVKYRDSFPSKRTSDTYIKSGGTLRTGK